MASGRAIRPTAKSQHPQIEDPSPGRGGARVVAQRTDLFIGFVSLERKVIHREFFTTSQSDRSRFFAKSKPGGPRTSLNRRPVIEGLEDRVVLSTITWNTTAAPKGGALGYSQRLGGGQGPRHRQHRRDRPEHARRDGYHGPERRCSQPPDELVDDRKREQRHADPRGRHLHGLWTRHRQQHRHPHRAQQLMYLHRQRGTVTDAGTLTTSNSSGTSLSQMTMTTGSSLTVGARPSR